jgi:hypothetical protein
MYAMIVNGQQHGGVAQGRLMLPELLEQDHREQAGTRRTRFSSCSVTSFKMSSKSEEPYATHTLGRVKLNLQKLVV